MRRHLHIGGAFETALANGDLAALRTALGHPAACADPTARTRIDHYATPLEEAEIFNHAIGAAALRAHPSARRS